MAVAPKLAGRATLGSLILAIPLFWLATLGPTQAESLKSIMRNMAETTKAAKGAVSSNDAAKVDQLMQAYGSEAKAALALLPGGGSKNQDLRARFSQFATTVDGVRRASDGSASFKAAFGKIVEECRSCHSVYK